MKLPPLGIGSNFWGGTSTGSTSLARSRRVRFRQVQRLVGLTLQVQFSFTFAHLFLAFILAAFTAVASSCAHILFLFGVFWSDGEYGKLERQKQEALSFCTLVLRLVPLFHGTGENCRRCVEHFLNFLLSYVFESSVQAGIFHKNHFFDSRFNVSRTISRRH